MARLCVAIIGQIATVPIYLSYWDAATYGVWLILQGLLGYLILFSTAFQQFTYAEVLKQGPNAPNEVRKIYWTSLAVGHLIAAVELAAIAIFAPSAVDAVLPEHSDVTAITIVNLLLLFGVLNMVLTPFGAITSQTMTIHGYYPRSAAWGLFHVIVILLSPAVAVFLGANLLTAGLVQVGMHTISATLMIADFGRLARTYGLFVRTQVQWRTGFLAALHCLPLAGRGFIDSFRQQGFRILLGGYAGAAAVTTFATTRTIANVLHQGLSTITAPLLPDLMRYVVNRDQERLEGAFAVVWLFVLGVLMPGVLLLCTLVEPAFVFWTRGEVPFDPLLFLTLMATVLGFAAGQPAISILQGRNQIAWQIGVSVIAAVCLLAFVFAFVPPFGIVGAGFALFGAEVCATLVAVEGARRTLVRLGLHFPKRSFALVAFGILGSFSAALPGVYLFEAHPAALSLALAVNVTFLIFYWVTIPMLVRQRIRRTLSVLLTKLSPRT